MPVIYEFIVSFVAGYKHLDPTFSECLVSQTVPNFLSTQEGEHSAKSQGPF